MDTNTRRDRIRELNDNARRFLIDGRVYVTHGISALPAEDQALIFSRVCSFDDFTPDNDPYGEHDFGAFDHNGIRIFWKIDLYCMRTRKSRALTGSLEQLASSQLCWRRNINDALLSSAPRHRGASSL
jgi:hypothetical protein